MDLTSGSSGSDAPLTVSVSCIRCIVLFGARWPEACELCLACPPPAPPSMSHWLSGFYRFTVAPPERDCSGAHARSLARCLSKFASVRPVAGPDVDEEDDDKEEGAEEAS